ncbi:MAG: NAD-dependent deacylase [Spirochaetes bacterium]|nr:NAD-dependent deacylase [Spirochaetota bacterium]MBU0954827.1 NAD-dependent deacylase [Spirochaetota bacterium]
MTSAQAGSPAGTAALLSEAAALLRNSCYVMAFTGAGISVESGIPAFRGAGGLWGQYDERHLEIAFFRRHPELAWPTIRAIFYSLDTEPQPNTAHRVLAEWEQKGWLSCVVTQNIDGLHRKAGSRKLAEFHGASTELLCPACGCRCNATADVLRELPPYCTCGAVLKPDFVFFGEGIPPAAWRLSMEAAAQADLCLIIGSTGQVYPAASLPERVHARGGKIIEINPEPSAFTDSITDIYLPLAASRAMQELNRLR